MAVNKANATEGNRPTEAEMKSEVEHAAKVLASANKKSISIPKQMASVLGETMIAGINGAFIRVPVDGEEYEIPEPYYNIIKESLKTVNSEDVRGSLTQGANDQFLEDLVNPSK
jgi:hypothetical protein